jgi:ADP-ribose pyrophosphatase
MERIITYLSRENCKCKVGTVSLEDGKTAFREVIEHPGGVCIAVLHEGQVVLVRQFRIAIGKYILEAPAGKLEQDEEPMERAKKELEEETGYRAGIFEYLGRHIHLWVLF